MKHLKLLVLLTVVLLGRFSVANSRYHFLWVVDNSITLEQQRFLLANHFNEFVDILNSNKKIHFKMAMVTTDFFTSSGKLVKDDTGGVFITNATSDPAKRWNAMVGSVNATMTSFWPQGLETSYLALKGEAKALIKENVPLIVIYVSAKEDYSCKGMKDGRTQCMGVEPYNNPDWEPFPIKKYVRYFKALELADNVPVTVFTITGSPDSPCPIHGVGKRYQQVQKSIGLGTTQDVCKANFERSMDHIAEQIAEHAKNH